MSNTEKLQKVIAAYTPIDYTQIDMTQVIKDHYVAAAFKSNFCHDIVIRWPGLNPTKLQNDMFVTLKTGNDILQILTYLS